MDRFIESGYPQTGDSNIATDGDTTFTGMDARVQPEKLAEGMAALIQNMRLDAYIATVRLGMAKQTNAIVVNGPPLIIPFTVGSGAVLVNTTTDGIFGVLVFSDPNNNNIESLVIFCGSQAYTMDANKNVASLTYPANEIIAKTDQVDYFQYGGYVYLSRGEISGILIPSTLTSSGTTATLTTSFPHGLSNGQWIRVSGVTQAPYNGDFSVIVTGSSSLTYTLPSTTTSPATGSFSIYFIKLPMKWNGTAGGGFVLVSHGVISQNFSYMNGFNFGITQVNRAILEYTRNQIIISQVENVESYDTINGIFTFGAGTADYLVGVSPYQDNQTLVFLRQSIWLINNVYADVASMSTQIVTNQVGCVAKRTIATCGANVLFLSERGVFILQPGYELLLRGNSLPLSAPVQPIIDTINFGALNVPCAVYFNNRYYLAVPISSSRNNTMLIYNFINEQWESQDTFPNGFYCDYLAVMLNPTGTPTLYCLSFEGGVYAYEQNEQDDFAAAGSPATQYPIQGLLTTRRFTFGTIGLKRFNRAMVNFQLDAGAGFTTEAITLDPTDTKQLPNVFSDTATEITRGFIIGKRSYGIQLQFQNITNRGSIVNYSIGAYVKDMKSTQDN